MKGRVTIELWDGAGDIIAARRVDNAVMRAGADLIARLFTGKGAPITHMGVGTSDAPESDDFATEKLSNEATGGADPLKGDTLIAIPDGSFTIDVEVSKRIVWVRARVTLPAAAAVGTIREAGLVAKSGDAVALYNRVVFAPVVKRETDELSMFWEVSFPYGDLPWSA